MRPLPNPGATSAGFAVALLAPPLWAHASREADTLGALIVGQLGLWAIAGVLLLILQKAEGESLPSLGWRRPRWRSGLLGVGAALVLLWFVSPLAAVIVAGVTGDGLAEGMDRLRGRPIGYMAFAAVTAGAVEEHLYRGFLLQRLERLTGSTGLAVVLGVAAFALVHLPFWGLAGVLFTVFGGLFFALLFVATRDLWVNVVAHAVTAFVQLLPLAH